MIDLILQRLKKVRKTKPGQWMACCPAHDDKNPSLSLFENNDGRILLHCFAGCGGSDIVSAIGLTLADLYPDGALRDWFAGANRSNRIAKQKATEIPTIVLQIAEDMRASGKRLTASEMREEREAFFKLQREINK